jgi:hypothetical protein
VKAAAHQNAKGINAQLPDVLSDKNLRGKAAYIRERVAGLRSLTEGLDTAEPMGTAVLTITAAFAQLGRDTMIERTRAGLAAANNRHGGRPGKVEDAAAARPRNSKAKASAPPTSARCLGSPARRSTDTFSKQRNGGAIARTHLMGTAFQARARAIGQSDETGPGGSCS